MTMAPTCVTAGPSGRTQLSAGQTVLLNGHGLNSSSMSSTNVPLPLVASALPVPASATATAGAAAAVAGTTAPSATIVVATPDITNFPIDTLTPKFEKSCHSW